VADIQVTVGQQHIDKGHRESACACPVALAIQAKVLTPGTPGVVTVGRNRTTLCRDLTQPYQAYEYYDIPPEVAAKIEVYDMGGTMEPFTFTLRERRCDSAVPFGGQDGH